MPPANHHFLSCIEITPDNTLKSLEKVKTGVDKVIKPLLPVFFYLEEYPQIEGSVNVGALITRRDSTALTDSDRMMIRLLEIAEMDYQQMEGINNTNELANVHGRSEGLAKASERVTAKILKYWPQKEHLQIRIEPKIAADGDPKGRQAGVNIWIEIYDKNKKESVPLDQRSKGFIWSLSLLSSAAHTPTGARRSVLMNKQYLWQGLALSRPRT